jgi:xanthine dehydrogenase accessory factor
MAVTAVPALIDPYTAVVLLHHDLEIEMPVLEVALASSAFYIGALGSTRTHRNRVQRLELSGTDRQQIDRIKAPIGMFGPTKDATALALSVLADIAAARLVADN